MYDLLLRTGPEGDRFGLRRRGWSLKRLRRHPHGVEFGYGVPTGVMASRITHADKRVHLADPAILAEVERMEAAAQTDPDFPLRMFGRRELRSINSWMHNSQKLQRANPGPTLRVHADDAAAFGVVDGATARLTSRGGSVNVAVEVSDEVQPGAVCLPHGWGHGRGGWKQANAIGGPNANALTRAGVGTIETLAGMTILNGLPVRLEPVVVESPDPAAVERIPVG
jgi:formate dehydrogenase